MTLNKAWEDELKIRELIDKLRQQISYVDRTQETYGIIAGDVHGYNQHFTKDNQLTMFDFEFLVLMDTESMILLLFYWELKVLSNEELWNAFLNGYQSVRKLNDSEMEAIEAFVQARNLWWISSLSKMPQYQHIFDEEFWKSAFSQFETYLLN